MKKYAKQINEMAKRDQELRREYERRGYEKDLEGELERNDKENTRKLKAIIREIGFPTISKVGAKASKNAWLIVQHSPDLQFMKDYLALMEANLPDVDVRNCAYLKDRILVYEGKNQIYGTQFRLDAETKKFQLATPLQNEKECGKPRKECGLVSLSEQIEKMKTRFGSYDPGI